MRPTPRRTAVALLSALVLSGLTGSVAHAADAQPATASAVAAARTVHKDASSWSQRPDANSWGANSWGKANSWRHHDANSWSVPGANSWSAPGANSWSAPDANSWSTPDANSWGASSDDLT